MIDENEAPDGYRAVQEKQVCLGCAFYVYTDRSHCLAGEFVECVAARRSDGADVIFVKMEEIQ